MLNNRYEFVLLFDVKNGNPNGNPDAGNTPRIDEQTGVGLVTDVCLKRKVRNFVEIIKNNNPPDFMRITDDEQPNFEIYVKEKAILNKQHERAYEAIGASEQLKVDKESKEEEKDKKRKGGDKVEAARKWMCKNFYDVRTFGAVMSTGVNCGQVRGPIQFTFAKSIDQVVISEHTITRMAVATEKESEAQGGDNRTMGRKYTIPYGLYVAHGFISAHLAEQTGFSENDLELFFQSLELMFDHDHSASRGDMNTRGLYVFKHDSRLGNAPAYKLFDLISIKKNSELPPRDFSDYEVTVNETGLPSGVQLIRRVG